jgi:uncharacterized phage infection (PIP) family protein YhgE
MPTLTSLSRPLAVGAVVLGLVVAGCGNSDKNDYVKQVNQAIASLQKSLTDVGGAVNASGSGDVSAAASVLEKGGKAMDTTAAKFEGIKPPSDAKEANAKIADGLHKLAGSFRDMAKEARAKDVQALTKSLGAFQTSPGAQEIQQAQDELSKAGYKIANG